MWVGVLGPVSLEVDGTPIAVSGSRLRRLLCRLAAAGGRPVPVSALVDAVWGEDPPAGAGNALQSLVSRLRRVCGTDLAVESAPGGYRLAVGDADVDAQRFLGLADRGHRLLAGGDAAAAVDVLTEALALWRGEALADADGSLWAQPLAAQWQDRRRLARSDLWEAQLRLGRAVEVVADLESAAAADLLREHTTALLMAALAATGRPAEALAAYERLRRHLADELGVDPSAELQQAHLRLLDGRPPLPDVQPAVPTGPAGPAVLTGPAGPAGPTAPTGPSGPSGPAGPAVPPAPEPAATSVPARAFFTSFVGREQEERRARELIGRSRLVTVVGPGGAGKTRLAAQLADDSAALAPDGRWWVELAPVGDPGGVPQAVLDALGARASSLLDRTRHLTAATPLDRITGALADLRGLLVLDNCEHQLGPVAELVEHLLSRCPELRVLATSREPLGLVGESVCALPPLAVPPPDVSLEAAPRYAALRLLLDRAHAATADFALTAETLPSAVDVVRRLDGLPLAIELAAARLRVLSVDEVAERLSDRFRLLSGGTRSAVPRHRTLRAVVEWSWDLLSPPERLLAERLSVFPAGATAESAAAVCGDDRLPAADVPELLLALVDKSLVQAADGRRYRMLETIREFGVERLVAAGEADAARRAHALHYIELAERTDPLLRTDRQLAASRVFGAERENFLAALRDCADRGAAEDVLRLAVALSWYWWLTDSYADIVAVGELTLLATQGSADPRRVLIEATYAIGAMTGETSTTGDSAAATEPAGVLELAQRLRDSAFDGEPALSTVLRPLLFFFGDDSATGSLLAEQVMTDRDPWVRATMHLTRAQVAENAGDIETLRTHVEVGYRLFAQVGDRWGMANALTGRAGVRLLDGDTVGAMADYEAALDYVDELGAVYDSVTVRMRLADLRLRSGDMDGARTLLASSRERIGRSAASGGGRHTIIDAATAMLVLQEGDLAEASRLAADLRARTADQDAPVTGPGGIRVHMIALVRTVTATIALAVGDLGTAAADLELAMPAALRTSDMPIVANTGTAVAALLAARGDAVGAARALGTATALRGGEDLGDPRIAALTADLRQRLGEDGFRVAYEDGRVTPRDVAPSSLADGLSAAQRDPLATGVR
ncbi:AfsR/SARP family transcriptional regulator [Nakamurella endophytica]|uniref:SARP family transcriptional regulator n=1 Tax=Nakamurella endophytica TaxID=1748367 RepID=A0A917SVP9_9ACTN|nr:BTAD domain-containing putative transcriptional regulator [Nakamurella endophytica]GGM01125.1 SARP family transcriptional regulator [Nakamurella endophytica]